MIFYPWDPFSLFIGTWFDCCCLLVESLSKFIFFNLFSKSDWLFDDVFGFICCASDNFFLVGSFDTLSELSSDDHSYLKEKFENFSLFKFLIWILKNN